MPQLGSERGASVATQPKVEAHSVEDAVDSGAAYFKLKPGPGKSARDVRCHQQARIHSAMLDVVAEQGYDAATVRRLAQRAGVSTRTFYQHYPSKEKCFVRTQELIARGWSERVVASQEAGNSEEASLWLGARALLRAWIEWPAAARLMLVDSWEGGSVTIARSQGLLRAIATKCSCSGVGESRTANSLAEAVVVGMAAVMRSRLIDGQSIEIEDELLEWVAFCISPGVAFDALASEPFLRISSNNAETEVDASPEGDRALLLSAVCRLATKGLADVFTPKTISDTAGVSQRKFRAAFPSLDDCLIAAAEWRTKKAVDEVRRHCYLPANRLLYAYRSAHLLCAQMSEDVALVNLCSGQIRVACKQQLRGQKQMAKIVASLLPGESAEIAAEASAFSILAVLQAELAQHQTVKSCEVVPTLTRLLLAPPIKSGATEGIDLEAAAA